MTQESLLFFGPGENLARPEAVRLSPQALAMCRSVLLTAILLPGTVPDGLRLQAAEAIRLHREAGGDA